MGQKGKFLALALSAVMALGVCMASACGTTTDDSGTTKPPAEQENPPAQKTPEVKSVAIKYSDAAVEGELSLALSTHTFELVPVVTADEGATYTVAWTSTEPDVATVEGDNTKATVTLNGGGETFIKAEAGAKSAQFVLTVDDDTPPAEYTITVVNGTAKNADGETITKATAGTQVTLEATTPEHKTFKEWTFDNEDVALNGATFTMPEGNITATATFTDTLYPLTVVGGTVTKAGEAVNPKGTEGAGDTEQTKEMTYGFAYGTEVTIKAVEAEEGKIFVAWDYQFENNRKGDLGIDEYTFTMGDEEATKYTAIFSDFSPEVWLVDNVTYVGGGGATQNLWSDGAKTIKHGGEEEELEGLSGYTLSIPGGTKASTGYPTNIAVFGKETSAMNTLEGRAMGKFIFRNHGTVPITLEAYATYCGVLISTGDVTIQPDEVVVKYITMSIGFENPWWGVQVREDVAASGNNLVDMVFGMAKTLFPNGDPYLNAGGDAEIVTFGPKGAGAGADFTEVYTHITNNRTVLQVCGWGSRFGEGENRWYRVRVKESTLPAFDESNPKLTIYGRVINNMNHINEETADYKASWRVVLGANKDDPTQSSYAYDFTFTEVGEIVTFKLEIDRPSADAPIFLFLVKPTLEEKTDTYGYAVIAQFAFNNAFGYEEV